MFTGIVEEAGTLRSLVVGGESAVLEVSAASVLEGTAVGDSIATDGVCLTVARLGADRFWADVMPETVRRSTLGRKRPGDRLNLERALTLQSRLGGHLVQGHVDGVGAVSGITRDRASWLVDITAPPQVTDVSVPQGSVAVDGVSLTIVAIEGRMLRVSLIPHTIVATTLHDLKVGAEVNLEADLIGKYVRAYLAKAGSTQGLTWQKLSEAGFV